MTERRTALPFNGRPTNAACYGPRVALWGVKDNRKVFEAAYGIVQEPSRLAVELDDPHVARVRLDYRRPLPGGHGGPPACKQHADQHLQITEVVYPQLR